MASKGPELIWSPTEVPGKACKPVYNLCPICNGTGLKPPLVRANKYKPNSNKNAGQQKSENRCTWCDGSGRNGPVGYVCPKSGGRRTMNRKSKGRKTLKKY